VIQEAQSEARNTTAQATSSGVPSRPIGYIAVSWALRSSGTICSSRSVRIVAGDTQLTRTPWPATSLATSWVSRTTPALATA
jgi:hypothetical protein